jgi:hypothetical protein
MDWAQFLNLLHQLFPRWPIILFVFVAVALLAFTVWKRGHKSQGQTLEAHVSISTKSEEGAQNLPSSQQLPDKAASIPPISVKAEVNPYISPIIKVEVTTPHPPQPSIEPSTQTSKPPKPDQPPMPLTEAPPIKLASPGSEHSAADAKEIPFPGKVNSPPQNPGSQIEQPEMFTRLAPAKPNDQARVSPTSRAKPDTYSHNPVSDTQRVDGRDGVQLTATTDSAQVADPSPASSTLERATPSGRLAAQRSMQRTETQAALRALSLITQKTYSYVRASQRETTSKRPFAHELLPLWQLKEYLEFVQPHLKRLRLALERLDIEWGQGSDDPRRILYSFLYPFNPSHPAFSPTQMREAMVNASQRLAEIAEKSFPVEKARKWGPNGAWFYSLIRDDSSLILDDDTNDEDIDEADAELAYDDEEGGRM